MVALALLDMLAHSMGWILSVGHVDHGLRDASREEAAMVIEHAASLGWQSRSTRLALETGSGLPARAREARHQALRDQARELGASHLVLGHTATDRAESMLMFMARGAGLAGLGTMPEHDDAVLRPLLSLTRAQVRALAEHLQLPFVDDPTNDALEHARVLVRREVLPRLESLNPQAQLHMCELAEQAHQANLALDEWARVELERCQNAGQSSAPVEHVDAAHGHGEASRGLLTLAHVRGLASPVLERVVRLVLAQGGADLSEIPRRTTLAIVGAIREPGEVRRFHVRPGREVEVTKHLLRVLTRPTTSHESG